MLAVSWCQWQTCRGYESPASPIHSHRHLVDSRACASEQTVTKTQVKKDSWGRDQRYSVGKDKDGNPMMKSDRRSSLEGKQSNMAANRDFSGRITPRSPTERSAGVGILFLSEKI